MSTSSRFSMRRLVAVLAVASFLTGGVACATEESDSQTPVSAAVKSPHYGPYEQSIQNVAKWQVPEGFVSLDQGDTTRLMELMQNKIENAYLFSPKGYRPWFAIVQYDETGHVSDSEKIDAEALMKQMKEGEKEENEERKRRGWAPFYTVGWRVTPHYEEDTKRLSWAILLKDDKGEETVNYRTKVLSRTGVATVTLVADPKDLDASVAELKTRLNDFSFTSGNQYAEFRKGDKVAEYGLAGLIVGGAAAAAYKTGFLKGLLLLLAKGGKLVIAGVAVVVAAIVGGIRKLFGGRDS